nr:vegetative incompatibility protein het-e-1 [Quercus suber]
MRLLKRSADGNIGLTSFTDDHLPPYAILSHTWTEGQEVTYSELIGGTGEHKAGHDKIRFCVEQAAFDGIEYSWVDSCCINKSTSDELSTAINSMFRWYQGAVKCYVYLSDVDTSDVVDAQVFQIPWEHAFRRSRWFTRGWTLQELLAPATVDFFSKDKKYLGSKISLEQEIHQITNIPVAAFRQLHLSDYSVEERFRWTTGRTTTYAEDKAYCLLGIFGVFLPLIYGEGEAHALQRVREEIVRRQCGSNTKNLRDLAGMLLFTGREDQLKSLEQSLSHPENHQRIAICGLGGCGKSAIALEFAYRAMSADPGHLVFWVPAISHQSFELAYREIGNLLRVPGITEENADVKKLVKENLNSHNDRTWLMIVDNADDIDILMQCIGDQPASARLYDYLPCSGRGKVLFTTRSKKAAESLAPSNVLELQDMGEAEAKQLLSQRITKKSLLHNNENVTELLEALTCLPLAIVQAAAFINTNDVSLSVYLSMLHETETSAELFGEHFEDHTRYREMDSTVAKTWYVSFSQIRRHDTLAVEYLSFMACIDRISIPQSLLPSGSSRLRHLKAIGTLKAYAFITERQHTLQEIEDESFFDMHRLVHVALAWWLDDQTERAIWTAQAAARLEKLIPYEGHSKRKLVTTYLPHAVHVVQGEGALDQGVRASLSDRIGRCQDSLGQYAEAVVTQVRTLEIRKTLLGPEHPTTLRSMCTLASVLWKQGKYHEAAAMDRQTLARREKVLGSEHPDTLMSMNNLASVLCQQGKYEEAEAMNRQTLELKEKVLGPGNLETLTSMGNLALVLKGQGKYEEAEAMNRQTLARRKTLLGPEDPHTLMSISNLAAGLNEQGKYEEAEAMHRQTLAQKETVLGPEHPDTLASMANLGLVLDNQGKYEEAEAINRQTLARTETVLGPEHPSTLVIMNNLASVLANQGKYEEAEGLYRQTLARREMVFEPEDFETLTSMGNLALVLYDQGKYEEAEAMNRQTLARTETVLGPEHPATLTSISNLALLLDNQGKYEEAEAMNRQTLARRETVLGLDHPHTLMSMSNLAAVLCNHGKDEEAEAMIRLTLEQRETVLGPEHPNTLTSVFHLAHLLTKLRHYEESVVLYKRALTGFNAVLGENHPTTRNCYQHFSQIPVEHL